MFLLFAGLAELILKTWDCYWWWKNFEPVVLFIRDEIAIPNIGEKHYKKYMSYLLTIFLCVILKYFGLMPFGINVTGNLTITFALA
jgi:F-type H+-transporting ATPase subunit a